MELDSYHENVNIRIASLVTNRLKTLECKDFRKKGNLRKIPEMLDEHVFSRSPKRQIFIFAINLRRIRLKNSIEKPILLHFCGFVCNILFKAVFEITN